MGQIEEMGKVGMMGDEMIFVENIVGIIVQYVQEHRENEIHNQ